MGKNINWLCILPFVFLFILLGNIPSYSQSAAGSYIVKFRSADGGEKLLSANKSLNLRKVFSFHVDKLGKYAPALQKKESSGIYDNLRNYYVLDLKNNADRDKILASLSSDKSIESITPNYIYHIDEDNLAPNDSLYSKQWALQNINAGQAWEKASGKGIIIGLIDTGIDFNHDDLKDNLWINSKEDINHNGRFDPWPSDKEYGGVYGDLNGKDDDGNGFVDDVIGYDFVSQSDFNLGDVRNFDPVPKDEMYHGTNVAGIMSATRNNKIGISGLAYDSKIMTVRAFDYSGNAQSDNIATAIVYAALNGAKVLNFSFGETYSSPLIHDAIRFAYSLGCVMVASSGNSNSPEFHYPSDYSEVISVGGSTSANTKWGLSNYGSLVDILAPGELVITTTLNNKYKLGSGTSVSAPHVSAAAALLLELDPKLTKNDIIGILQSTATDVAQPGWDYTTSAGILNIGAAINYVSPSRVALAYPVDEMYIYKDKTSSIPVVGSVTTPLFNSYRVFIGKGLGGPGTVWQPVSDSIFTQSLSDTLAVINTSGLSDTIHTVRLVVYLKNTSTMEDRSYINIVSPDSPFDITSVKTFPVWHGGLRKLAVAAVTNQLSVMTIKFLSDTGDTVAFSNTAEISKYHNILIENAPKGRDIDAVAMARRTDGVEARFPFKFNIPDDNASIHNFARKSYSLPMSQLFNGTSDLYGDGKQAFAAVDISSGSLEGTSVYEFSNNDFIVKDSLPVTQIPVGYGDSNGDGINEIFTKVSGSSTLFQSAVKGGSVFASKPFSETENTLWAAGMDDLDADGRPELIAYNDSSFNAYSFKNGSYVLSAMAVPPIRFGLLGTLPGFASGDFDGDGNKEICFGNQNGRIFIYEYSGGSFRPEFIDSSRSSEGQEYITSADIDGDGIPEVVIMSHGTSEAFGNSVPTEPMWNFRILKSSGKNQYYYAMNDYAYGGRDGFGYKNGVAAGNLDGKPGDEIVFSVFPDLYVFKWSTSKNKPELFWYYPQVFSNSALIHDFDNNGINELGISTFNGTEFFELKPDTNQLSIPSGLDGWALNDTSAFLRWNPVENAEFYNIYKVTLVGDQYNFELAAVANDTKAVVGSLENNTDYMFAVTAASSSRNESGAAGPVDIFTHNPYEPVSVYVIDSLKLLVSFNGKLPETTAEPVIFAVTGIADKDTIYPLNVNRANDTTYLLAFATSLKSGKYTVLVRSFADYYRMPTREKTLSFEVLPAVLPEPELFLSSLEVLSFNRLLLKYSEPVISPGVTNPSNYILKPEGQVSFIEFDAAKPDQVIINLDPASHLDALGKTYTLTVVDVKAESGHDMTKGAGNTLGFVFSKDNVSTAYVYPDPIKISEKPHIYFAHLTPYAEVQVLTLEGEVLAEFKETDGNGGVEWDGYKKNGELIDAGVYLFKVTGRDKNGNPVPEALKKFVVIK